MSYFGGGVESAACGKAWATVVSRMPGYWDEIVQADKRSAAANAVPIAMRFMIVPPALQMAKRRRPVPAP